MHGHILIIVTDFKEYSIILTPSPAELFQDAGFATFLDGILRKWLLKLRETE